MRKLSLQVNNPALLQSKNFHLWLRFNLNLRLYQKDSILLVI